MAFTANVVDGNIILASWGNEIRDRTLQVFATVAERDSQWPSTVAPNGAHCVTLDTGSWWRNVAATWTGERSAWTDVAPGADWSVPAGYVPFGWRLEGFGAFVAFKGTLQKATAGTGSITLLTLPAGARPTGQIIFPVPTNQSLAASSYIHARAAVAATGVFQIQFGAYTLPVNGAMSFDGIRFGVT
jgi:hypothetical protein